VCFHGLGEGEWGKELEERSHKALCAGRRWWQKEMFDPGKWQKEIFAPAHFVNLLF